MTIDEITFLNIKFLITKRLSLINFVIKNLNCQLNLILILTTITYQYHKISSLNIL